MKNYLWNMFAAIKNGQLARRRYIYVPRKKISAQFLDVLWDEGFISGYKIDLEFSTRLQIFLKYYKNGRPAINSLKTIGKPSRHLYYSKKQLWKIDSSKALVILSTNKGLISVLECKRLGIGGKPYIVIT